MAVLWKAFVLCQGVNLFSCGRVIWSCRKFSWWKYIEWLEEWGYRKEEPFRRLLLHIPQIYVLYKYMGSAPVLETDLDPGAIEHCSMF